MANKPLKSITFPGLTDTYTFAQIDDTLAVAGKAADSKAVGDEIADVKADLSAMNAATSSDVGKALKAKTVTDGKVTEWEFGEAGGESDTVEIDLLDIAGDVTSHTYTSLSTTGAVSTASLSNQVVREFTIPSGYKYLRFTAQSRVSGENTWCLYNASSFETCGTETVVNSGRYTNAQINTLELTDDCKMLLVMSRDAMGTCSLYNTISVERTQLDFANPYDSARTYGAGDYCIYDGYLYKCVSDGVVGDWNADAWERVSYASERKRSDNFLKYTPFVAGKINSTTGAITTSTADIVSRDIIYVDRDVILKADEKITGLSIWYYANPNNGSVKGHTDRGYTGWAYIKKGSYIRIVMSASSIPRRPDRYNEIASLLTFATVYDEDMNKINEVPDAHSLSEVANMYQKGVAEKEYSLPQCILVAGQSNIDGRVPHASLPTEMDIALPNIMNGGDNGTFSAQDAPSGNVGIDWPMFYKLNEIGTTFYKIKKSLGATAISPLGSTQCWTPFYEELTNISNSLLLAFDKKIKKCLKVTPNTFDIRAFVWQQGEGDFIAQNGLPRMWKADVDYYNNFKCLVAYVRGVAGNKRLPVVCGTVSHRSGQYDPVVEAATLKVAEEDPYMICIDMSGAKLLDSYHFNADSAVYFGYKAFDALIDLGVITATKINPTRPWEEYTITYNLTNCYSNSYGWDLVRYDGQSLTRKIFADSGYTLDEVTVTMGGEDITETAYSSGTVTISDVQGDIVITATATANA